MEAATILIRPFFRAKRLNLRKKLFPSSTVLAPNMVQYLYFRLLTFPADFSTSSVIDFTSHAGAICRRCFSARSLALLGAGWRFWLGKNILWTVWWNFDFLSSLVVDPFSFFLMEQLLSGYVLFGIQIHLRPLKIESFQGSIPKVETQTDKKNLGLTWWPRRRIQINRYGDKVWQSAIWKFRPLWGISFANQAGF